jgi:hypothetical protein
VSVRRAGAVVLLVTDADRTGDVARKATAGSSGVMLVGVSRTAMEPPLVIEIA